MAAASGESFISRYLAGGMPSPAMSTSPFCSRRIATSGSCPISTRKPSRFGRSRKYSALREKTSRWPVTHSSSLKAPEPTGFLPKSPPSASTTSLGTADEKFSARTLRKVASGWVRVNFTVASSGASMPVIVWAEPSAILSWPTIE